jgi:MFS family permease
MVPRHLLDDRTRRVALITMLLMGSSIAAYVYFISLYLQLVLAIGPLLTGLALVPATATVMVTSMLLARRLVGRLGVRLTLVIGLAFIAAGMLCFTQLNASGSYLVNVLPGVLLTSFGMGLALPAISVAVTAGVDPSEQGSAGALMVSAQQIGAAAGLALLATVAAAGAQAPGGSTVAGYQLAFDVLVVIVLVALAGVLLLLRSKRA